MLLVSDLLCAVLMMVLALAVASGTAVIVVGLLATATTAAGTAYMPATVALLPEMLDEDDLGAGNSLTSLIQSIAVVSGPAIGALLLVVAAPTWSFVVNAGSFALGAALTARISTRSKPERDAAHHGHPVRQFGAELADGARFLVDLSVVRVLTSLAVGASFIYGTQTVVLVLVANQVGNSSSGVGLLYAALGVGGVLGAPIAARASRERRLGGIALGALIVSSVPMALLANVHDATIAFILVAISGAGMVVVDVLSITLLQRSVDNDVMGRVVGIFDASTVAAITVGALIVAPLINATGYTSTLIFIAIVTPLFVVFQLRSLLHADRDAALTWSQQQFVVQDLKRVRSSRRCGRERSHAWREMSRRNDSPWATRSSPRARSAPRATRCCTAGSTCAAVARPARSSRPSTRTTTSARSASCTTSPAPPP